MAQEGSGQGFGDNRGVRGHPALLAGTEVPPPSRCPRDEGDTHVMTDASARKACAVASFLMHFTATLFPR